NILEEDFESTRKATVESFQWAVLVLSAAVMKADGRKLKSELDYIKGFLVANFGELKAREQLPHLKKLLETDIPLRQVCLQIRENTDHPARIQLMHYLFGIAIADGDVDATEEHVLQQIANYLYINAQDMASLRAMYVQDKNW